MRFNPSIWRSYVCLCALLIGGAPVAARSDVSAERKAIQAQYDRIAAAFVRKDVAGALAPIAPDFTNIGVDGKIVNRAQMAAILKENFPGIPSGATARVGLDHFKLLGNKAVVNATVLWITTTPDPKGARGRMHTQVDRSVSTDTWVKTNGRWMMQLSQDKPSPPAQINGKPAKAGAGKKR
jgi:uncharacterized protein (TIGR02246 family)